MPQDNYRKMFEVINEVFSLRTDADQLQVTEVEQKKLAALHPACLSELANDAGPLIWCLVIPTTQATMQKFLVEEISESELLEQTTIGDNFTAIYLCSVTTLPEIRSQGKSYALCEKAIRSICETHAIRQLYVWPFSTQGLQLALKLSANLNLPLLQRPHSKH
jgi:hypothetical protein